MFGKGSNKDKQSVTILEPQNSVIDDFLDIAGSDIEKDETTEAWTLQSIQQCKDERTGLYVQYISPTSATPIQLYRGTSGQKVTVPEVALSVIGGQVLKQKITYYNQQKAYDSRLLWMGIVTGLLTLTLCIVVLVVVL